MITVVVVMTIGIALGLFLDRIPKLIKAVDKLISYAIYLLLFLLGISVGINEQIISNLDTIGIKALMITLGAIGGSVLVSWALYKTMFASQKIKGGKNEE
uniref:LysO family transporter n=1 Tax=uncultured Draconibacterium sp. TaxID=1573823 RepID=UPI0032180F56